MSFNPIHCEICTDKRKFSMKVNEARRILASLERLMHQSGKSYKITPQDQRKINGLICKTHVHFMCGYCRKVNEQELWTIENDLKEKAFILYKITITEDTAEKDQLDNITHTCQRLLSGHYPTLARLFYR